MYYKLLRWVKDCWKSETLNWHFYPDENSSIDWQELLSYIQNTNLSKNNKYELTLFGLVQNLHFPRVDNHQQLVSTKEPLVQLIDLFTGFARFSFEHGKEYLNWKQWKEQQAKQTLLEMIDEPDVSKNIIDKFDVFEQLITSCQKKKMGVSINTNSYLKTFDYRRHLNFWKYEPQNPNDKAPVKIKEYNAVDKPFDHTPNETSIAENS